MIDLLPCPFCGDPNPRLTHDDYVHDDLRPMPVVECTNCHTWVRAESWNTRAKAAPAQPQSDAVIVPRELLERVVKPVLFTSQEDSHYDACTELRALLGGDK